jgi:hypothetical protein
MGLAAAIRMLTQHSRIISTTTTGAWNSGVATSGNPGADLYSYGQANRWWRLQESYLLLAAFNAAATVTVRAYEPLMGAEREIMNEDWVVAADGDVVFIVWFWEVEMFGPLRVEVFSNNAGDDGLVVPYELRVKDW